MRDPRAEAIRAYADDAAYIREQARDVLRAGDSRSFYELLGLAAIAERAAKAEMIDREPATR